MLSANCFCTSAAASRKSPGSWGNSCTSVLSGILLSSANLRYVQPKFAKIVSFISNRNYDVSGHGLKHLGCGHRYLLSPSNAVATTFLARCKVRRSRWLAETLDSDCEWLRIRPRLQNSALTGGNRMIREIDSCNHRQ